MRPLTKTGALKRADKIVQLITASLPFEKPLARLYLDLSHQGQPDWTLEIYRHLSLYTAPQQKHCLEHPAVIQAFLAVGDLKRAKQMAQRLLAKQPANPEIHKLMRGVATREQNDALNYTSLAALSRYAAETASVRHRKNIASLPPGWEQALSAFGLEKLQETGYMEKRKQLGRAPWAFRTELENLFDELTLNYLFQNRRAVAVLSGALLELLMVILLKQLFKKNKSSTSAENPNKILDLSLNNLIEIGAQYQLLPPNLLKLSRVARWQRNLIHPGKNIQAQHYLTPARSRLCFLTVLELIDIVFPNTPTNK